MVPIGLALRIFVYLTVIAGCITALCGIENSQSKTVPKVLFNGSQCLLFGQWYSLPSKGTRAFGGGDEGWCTFVKFAAGSQLALAVIMAVVAIMKMIQYHRAAMLTGDLTTFATKTEQLFVVPALVLAVLGATFVSAGMADTCSTLLKKWNLPDTVLTYSDLPKPLDCDDAYVWTNSLEKSKKKYFFYYDLNVAQVGLWLTCIWFVHILISPILTRWRRNHMETEELLGSGKYQPMAEIL